jgi:hypothetical protein
MLSWKGLRIRQMVRTAVGIVVAVCLTLALLSFGTFVILRATEFGKVAMGNSQGVADPWNTFMAGQNLLFFYLDLPITLVISFLTAVLTRRFSVAAGVLGTVPVWALLLVGGDLTRGSILVLSAAVAAFCAARWQKNRPRKAARNAFATTHSN